MIPLLFVEQGNRAKIVRFQCGHEALNRFLEIGLAIGDEIEIVRGGGPVILKKENLRIMIGRGMAGRVMVIPLSGLDQV